MNYSTKTLDGSDFQSYIINQNLTSILSGNVEPLNLTVDNNTTLGDNINSDILNINALTTFNGPVYLNNNIISNSMTITAQQIGFLSNLSSDVQTAINLLISNTNYITNNNAGSTLISDNLTIMNSKMLGLFNASNQYSSFSFNSSGNLIITNSYGSITITTSNLIINSTCSINGNLTIPSSYLLNLVGNISCNSQTITPVILSYLSGCSGNIQTAISLCNTNITSLTTSTTANTTALTNISYGSNGGHPSTFMGNYLQMQGGSQIHIWDSTNTYYTAFGQTTASGNFVTNTNGSAYSYTISSSNLIVSSIMNVSGLITCSGGITIPTTQILTLLAGASISANSLTVSAVQIGYLSNITSDINTSLTSINTILSTQTTALTNISYNSSNTTINNNIVIQGGHYIKLYNLANTLYSGITPNTDGSLTINTYAGLYNLNLGGNLINITAPLTVSGLITASLGITIPTTQILTLPSGASISANSLTVSAVQMGYLSTLSSNVQSQFSTINTTLSGVTTLSTVQSNANTFTGVTTFNNSGGLNISNGINSTISSQPTNINSIGYISSNIGSSGTYTTSGILQYFGGNFNGSLNGVYLLNSSLSIYSNGATATNITVTINSYKNTTLIPGTNYQTFLSSMLSGTTQTFNLPSIPVYINSAFTPNIGITITYTSTGSITIPNYNIFYTKLI